MRFTDEQVAAIAARDENLLLSAAAGSGKTATLVERVMELAMEGTDVDTMLVVTFTRAAAAGMREKLSRAMADSAAQGTWSGRFTDYLTVFTALRAAGMFLLFKSLLGHKETRSRAVRMLAGCSFCVYLSHPLAVMAGNKLWFRFTGRYAPVTVPQQLAFYLAVLGGCVLGSLVLASVPGLCRLFTGQSFSAACRSSNLFALFSRREGGQDPS